MALLFMEDVAHRISSICKCRQYVSNTEHTPECCGDTEVQHIKDFRDTLRSFVDPSAAFEQLWSVVRRESRFPGLALAIQIL